MLIKYSSKMYKWLIYLLHLSNDIFVFKTKTKIEIYIRLGNWRVRSHCDYFSLILRILRTKSAKKDVPKFIFEKKSFITPG